MQFQIIGLYRGTLTIIHSSNYCRSYNLKVCDNGMLVQLLYFWTLPTILFLFRRQDSVPVFR
jgi:hypothetical protein